MHRLLTVSLLLLSHNLFAQFHLGIFGGTSSYNGELNDKLFNRTKPAVGLSLNYELSDRVMLRSGFTYGSLEGGDVFWDNQFLKENRNLHFKTNLLEASLVGELTAFNLYNIRWSPYAFAGVALFHYNPYTYSSSGEKVYLKPLSTEGQGLPQYPERSPYNLTDLSIPFGGGVKYNLSDKIRIGLEIGWRKLFTDYLDDISTSYADPAILLQERGQQAVDLSYRGDEVPGEVSTYPDNGYPAKGAQRGVESTKDWYYLTGLHITFRLGSGYARNSSLSRRKGYDCPKNF
jgi:hypothetical protein